MLKMKVCLLGSYGVGKTSLVARYVHSMFADKYHTTVGVKSDKKLLEIEGQEITLMRICVIPGIFPNPHGAILQVPAGLFSRPARNPAITWRKLLPCSLRAS